MPNRDRSDLAVFYPFVRHISYPLRRPVSTASGTAAVNRVNYSLCDLLRRRGAADIRC
jgi:hypothetical protein